MKGFVFNAPTTVVFGSGSIASIAGQISRLGCKNPLVITGPRIGSSPLLDELKGPLEEAGLGFRVYDGVSPEPPAETIAEAVNVIRQGGYDLLVGFGGGSTMDFAKIASILAVHDVRIEDMAGNDRVPAKGLPTIMVPTTSGSGSEVSPVAVLSGCCPGGSCPDPWTPLVDHGQHRGGCPDPRGRIFPVGQGESP